MSEDVTRRALESIAEIAEQTDRTPQAIAVSDQLVHRTSAALADVHAHAMARVELMRDQLNDLEQTIIDARKRAEDHVKAFMQIVTDGEESIRSMEMAVHRIGDHLNGG
jgi:vacuolar-type H+-ATPase subunit E/Vma4